ncbi:ParB/Srx family N-terminal domain-containing protein [Rhizobium sp. Leaf453]|uniref:ParB/Srx family N-terminal domain-containing protein n=1 Tax=Rhizobium sp. Leaf453 TaxID=1736380 RepID=UPI000713E297|nr:ParB/Srx family N-terminal domain-containing protein [Rhizobium sp. Leaf453]KQU08092.1 hypothetical protein ASG68_23915 [Rhizobium sp. Leaf453]
MTTTIIIDKLDADPTTVRKTYSADSIEALAASIKVNGILQNLVVRTAEKKGRYFVTAGERRRRALMLLSDLTQTVGPLPQGGDDLRATFRLHGFRRFPTKFKVNTTRFAKSMMNWQK